MGRRCCPIAVVGQLVIPAGPPTRRRADSKAPQSEGSIETFTPFSNESCISVRIRSRDGNVEYNSGGVKHDCNS